MTLTMEPIIATTDAASPSLAVADVLILPPRPGPIDHQTRPAFSQWPGLSLAVFWHLDCRLLVVAARDGVLVTLGPRVRRSVLNELAAACGLYRWWAHGAAEPLRACAPTAVNARVWRSIAVGRWDTLAGMCAAGFGQQGIESPLHLGGS